MLDNTARDIDSGTRQGSAGSNGSGRPSYRTALMVGGTLDMYRDLVPYLGRYGIAILYHWPGMKNGDVKKDIPTGVDLVLIISTFNAHKYSGPALDKARNAGIRVVTIPHVKTGAYQRLHYEKLLGSEALPPEVWRRFGIAVTGPLNRKGRITGLTVMVPIAPQPEPEEAHVPEPYVPEPPASGERSALAGDARELPAANDAGPHDGPELPDVNQEPELPHVGSEDAAQIAGAAEHATAASTARAQGDALATGATLGQLAPPEIARLELQLAVVLAQLARELQRSGTGKRRILAEASPAGHSVVWEG